MAVEHCYIDHERQIAIVAELQTDTGRELVGVAQLVADPNHESAEFAILVPDVWQGRGIGGTLLDYCLELARGWGIQRVTAETEPRNHRMLGLFRRHGFRSEVRIEDDVVLLEREIVPMGPITPAATPVDTGTRLSRR
jgi:acetyltransferase